MQLIRDSLRANPNNAPALNNLANVMKDKRRYDAAITFYQAALAIAPDYAQAHANLGSAYQERGDPAAAAACYGRALESDPNCSAAHCNLGTLLQARGQSAEAAEAYRRALETNPGSAQILANLGAALRESGQHEASLEALRKAVRIDPHSEAAYVNMGATYKELGLLDDAIRCQWQALKINPRSHLALNNLGNALREQGNFTMAAIALQKALDLAPDCDLALNNLGLTLSELGRADEAAVLFQKAIDVNPANPMAYSNLLFTLNYLPGTNPQALFEQHREFGRLFADPLTREAAPHANDPDPERRLRVGFVSGDLRDHPVANFIEPVFAAHDAAAFELFCYANQPLNDARSEQLRARVEHWSNVSGLPDAALAEAIRADGIDILVDLSGHTARTRLLVFARKPAPVQVTMIGYMQTTGMAAMDYRITDATLDPEGRTERFSVEELIRLPAGAAPFAPPAECPEVEPLPALTNGFVTFASFNNLAKVTPQVLEAWAALLRRLPDARLVIVGRAGNPLPGRLAELGIALDRVEMVHRLPMQEYLALHNRVDLLLDTFPYNGGSTTLLAAWMGVPFVTLSGAGSTARAGEALLKALGLPHFAATDVEGYVDAAVAAAEDLEALAAWRASARERLTPWFTDATAFTTQLQEAFRQIWRRWCGARRTEGSAALAA